MLYKILSWLNFIEGVFSIIAGLLVPAAYVIFGDMTDTFVDFGFLGGCSNETAYENCKLDNIPDNLDVEFNFTVCEFSIENFDYFHECAKDAVGGCVSDPDNATQICTLLEDFDNFGTGHHNLFLKKIAFFEFLQYPLKDFLGTMTQYSLYFCYLSIAQTLTAAIATSLSMLSAQRQVTRIRKAYFAATLRQEVAYYDTVDSAVTAQAMTQESKKIQDAIGEKYSTSLKCLASFVGGCGLGFYYEWKYSLAIFAFLPAIAIAAVLMFMVDKKMRRVRDSSYAKSNTVAEEVFSGIRTVAAFGKEIYELDRFNSSLELSKKNGIKFAPLKGLAMGFLPCVMYVMFGFGFWYGGQLILFEGWTVGEMFTCLLVVLIGVTLLSLFFTNLEYFTSAIVAAEKLYHLIERDSTVNYESTSGIHVPDQFEANISINNLFFKYPTRDQSVLNGISLEVKSGQTVALVGESGSGKSTVIQLLQRFYNYESGTIEICGKRIEDYSVQELRSQIGVVNQEPILFNKSIAENIRLGYPDATDKEIEDALAEANALDFVKGLPNGIHTVAGQQGGLLSGGQKQRICIARVLIKKPKLVLLDEATSALDLNSEALVQKSLENMGVNRTVVVVAHRLATIKNADRIYAMRDGKVVEFGTHDELIKKKGYYEQLCMLQGMAHDQEKDSKAKNVKESVEYTKKYNETDFGQDSKEIYSKSVFKELMKLNSPESCFIIFGCFFALCAGAVEPFFAVAIADFIYVFSESKTTEQLEDEILVWALVTGGLGLILMVTVFLGKNLFLILCEKFKS